MLRCGRQQGRCEGMMMRGVAVVRRPFCSDGGGVNTTLFTRTFYKFTMSAVERGTKHTLSYRVFFSKAETEWSLSLYFPLSLLIFLTVFIYFSFLFLLTSDSELFSSTENAHGDLISPFHDIPLWANEEVPYVHACVTCNHMSLFLQKS